MTQQRTAMEEAMLRAMVRNGIDKKQQIIKPETVIPQSTLAKSTYIPQPKSSVSRSPSSSSRRNTI